MKSPDMMINSDMKILQQILGMALQKRDGVSIPVFTINQVVINVTMNGDHRKAVVGNDLPLLKSNEGSGGNRRRMAALKSWQKRKEKDPKYLSSQGDSAR